ncbi:MAG: CapA family protein, partial [Oscillospiraceae bacterium]|nr:CapA family protein [Oscillospiraceae bacterium]
MKKHYLVTLILLLAVIALAVFVGIKGGMPGTNAPSTDPTTATQAPTTQPPAREVVLMAVGDNLIHKPLIDQARARAGGSGYDFTRFYQGVRPLIARADLAVINQESILA